MAIEWKIRFLVSEKNDGVFVPCDPLEFLINLSG